MNATEHRQVPSTRCQSSSEHTRQNLIYNGDFALGSPGALPDGWEAVCPNRALSPIFEWIRNPGRTGSPDTASLQARGNGRNECFGYVRQAVTLEAGHTYLLRVRLRFHGLDDLNRHLVHGVWRTRSLGGFNEGIFAYRRERIKNIRGEHAVGERKFVTSEEIANSEVRLYFRFSAHGQVSWDQVSLQECDPIAARPAKIACSWGPGDVDHWVEWLDQAGKMNVDVALLPEMFNGKDAKDAEPLDGPSGRLLADKARQWQMYVSGTYYEKCGDLVYNTAPLFDRQGNLLGIYRKNQLYDPEEDQGVTPGTGFPVFQTDLGQVGILICYDSWFPETARLLAYKGAELVLFPNAGYFAGLMPARTADNGIWIAVSSLNGPAGLWDPGGAMAGEVKPDPTRHAPSSVLSFTQDHVMRMIVVTVDLSRHYSPHWWGGPMRSAPGGRRVRQTLIEPIEGEIAREARRWWEE